MSERVSISQLAKNLNWLASDQTKEYFRNVEALGVTTRMSNNDTFSFALALSFFLSERVLFSHYQDPILYLDHLSGEISTYLEELYGASGVLQFYGCLARIHQAIARHPKDNPHQVAMNHAQKVLGNMDWGKDCPGHKMFLHIGAFLQVGAEKEIHI